MRPSPTAWWWASRTSVSAIEWWRYALTAAGTLEEDATSLCARAQLACTRCRRPLVAVPQVQRAPNGKADYRWARAAEEPEA